MGNHRDPELPFVWALARVATMGAIAARLAAIVYHLASLVGTFPSKEVASLKIILLVRDFLFLLSPKRSVGC